MGIIALAIFQGECRVFRRGVKYKFDPRLGQNEEKFLSTKLRQDCHTIEHMYLKFIFTQMVPCCLFSYFSEKNLLLYLFFL